jgi:hypothetical protein
VAKDSIALNQDSPSKSASCCGGNDDETQTIEINKFDLNQAVNEPTSI